VEGKVDMNADGQVADQVSCVEEMRHLWPFVQGMLTNLGALPLERIQYMLTQFVRVPKYERSIEDLREFMGAMVTEDIVGEFLYIF
jgi:hypothetical protein